MVAVSRQQPQPERLPPTEQAAAKHVMRVHHQVVLWSHKNVSALDPLQWGWKLISGKLEPVTTDLPPAPDDLLYVGTKE